jgi:tetratricopeptide (TPR) repeat protein
MDALSTTAREALASLRRAVSTSHDSAEYPAAVANVAYQLGRAEFMPPRIERFIAPYLASPRSKSDAEALYTLARIYQRSGLIAKAGDIYRLIADIAPGHRDVIRRMAILGISRTASGGSLDGARRPTNLMDRGMKEVTAAHSSAERRERLSADLTTRSRELGLPLLDVGYLIADRYEIVAPLGEGGYAVVFEVWDRMLEERVAMKLFRPAPSGKEDLLRFKQELRITRRLAHRNIVSTYDFKAWKGLHFITMELLEGADLLNVLEEMGGRLPIDQALLLAGQAYAGLGAAHQAGVVHRDIKPANLFVMNDGVRLKVMDFGIAKTRQADASLTRPGWLVGTPAYLAPERLESGKAGHAPAVDIYAMGVVLYRMVCGKLPFHEIDFEKLSRLIRKHTPPRPSSLVPSIPHVLDDLILALLAKKPADRPQPCYEVQNRIRKMLRGVPGVKDRSLF